MLGYVRPATQPTLKATSCKPLRIMPEHMTEAEFKRRFGGIDGVECKKMLNEMEQRVNAPPFYR